MKEAMLALRDTYGVQLDAIDALGEIDYSERVGALSARSMGLSRHECSPDSLPVGFRPMNRRDVARLHAATCPSPAHRARLGVSIRECPSAPNGGPVHCHAMPQVAAQLVAMRAVCAVAPKSRDFRLWRLGSLRTRRWTRPLAGEAKPPASRNWCVAVCMCVFDTRVCVCLLGAGERGGLARRV
jgi:hypothetical protein